MDETKYSKNQIKRQTAKHNNMKENNSTRSKR